MCWTLQCAILYLYDCLARKRHDVERGLDLHHEEVRSSSSPVSRPGGRSLSSDPLSVSSLCLVIEAGRQAVSQSPCQFY